VSRKYYFKEIFPNVSFFLRTLTISPAVKYDRCRINKLYIRDVSHCSMFI